MTVHCYGRSARTCIVHMIVMNLQEKMLEHLDKALPQLITNNIQGINLDFKVSGTRHEMVKTFKYLGCMILDKGLKLEILVKTAAEIPKFKTTS